MFMIYIFLSTGKKVECNKHLSIHARFLILPVNDPMIAYIKIITSSNLGAKLMSWALVRIDLSNDRQYDGESVIKILDYRSIKDHL